MLALPAAAIRPRAGPALPLNPNPAPAGFFFGWRLRAVAGAGPTPYPVPGMRPPYPNRRHASPPPRLAYPNRRRPPTLHRRRARPAPPADSPSRLPFHTVPYGMGRRAWPNPPYRTVRYGQSPAAAPRAAAPRPRGTPKSATRLSKRSCEQTPQALAAEGKFWHAREGSSRPQYIPADLFNRPPAYQGWSALKSLRK